MALFDLFRKKPKAAPEEEEKPRERRSEVKEAPENASFNPDAPRSYSGLRMEVTNPENALLFLARLSILQTGKAQLQQLSKTSFTMEQEEEAAAAEENAEPGSIWDEEKEAEPFEVQLRGYDEKQRQAIHMSGKIAPLKADLWRVEKLRVTKHDNDRAFFRQDTRAACEITPEGEKDVEVCEITNISAGGVCIRSKQEHQVNDHLLLRVRLIPSTKMTPLLCEVRRVSQKKDKVLKEEYFEYGCRFMQLNKMEEDQIAKSIMDIQREQARKQSGRGG